ncbi:MAG: DNA internalization-related competence protein ComEC/Rec2, partial [Acidobacteriota bacterium]
MADVRTPAALAALPLIAGAADGLLMTGRPDSRLALCGAGAALLCLVAAWGFLGIADGPGVVTSVVAGCFASGLSLGATAARQAYGPDLLTWFDASDAAARGDPVVILGTLIEDASAGPLGWSVLLDVDDVDRRSTRGGVRLSIGGSAADAAAGAWRAGRRVRLPAILRKPTRYGDPGVPDDVRALARRGTVLIGSVKSAALVEVVAAGGVVDEAAAAARRWARLRLSRYVGRWSIQSAAIANAILIGDRSGLSDDDQRRLQEAGTYHVIAISGGNIAILTTMLLVGMRLAAVPGRAAAAVSVGVLLFYGRLTGASPSVSRAVAAACVYLAGRVLDHRGPALNALAVAAVAGVAYAPVVVFDAGFILSFGASLGILVGVPGILPAAGMRDGPDAGAGQHRFTGSMPPDGSGGGGFGTRAVRAALVAAVAMAAATLSAELAILPVSAAVFSRVTFAGLALNFAAIPLMTVVQGASMATLGTAPLAWIGGARMADLAAQLSGWLTHLAASWLVRSARLVDLAPWLSRDVLPPAWGLVSAYYAAAIVWLAATRFARAGMAGMAACAALILAGVPALARDSASPPPPGWLRVVFLDVGQGDATLVRLPDGHAMLVDAGGVPGSSFDIGGRIISPALRALGVWRLDTLVVTHADPDHIGGAPAVLRRFSPQVVWEGVPVPPHPRLRELEAAAAAANVTWRETQAGDRERRGGVELRVLHPPPPEWERQKVRNDDSVVLEISIGEVSIILPGDVGAEVERLLLPHLTPARLVVVKAPHHGSASSSGLPFVRATHPAAVIFSAGRGNRFGHPAPAVVDRYRQAGAAVFRTDEDGA